MQLVQGEAPWLHVQNEAAAFGSRSSFFSYKSADLFALLGQGNALLGNC